MPAGTVPPVRRRVACTARKTPSCRWDAASSARRRRFRRRLDDSAASRSRGGAERRRRRVAKTPASCGDDGVSRGRGGCATRRRAVRARGPPAHATTPCAPATRRSAATSSGATSTRRTGTSTADGNRGSAVTSPANIAAVPSPAAYPGVIAAAARNAPIPSPTEVSSALETTHGNPASAMTARAALIPPSGWAFTTRTSAAPARATASGSLAFRTLSSAAIRTPRPATRDRSSASSGTVATGLLGVLQVERREPLQRRSRLRPRSTARSRRSGPRPRGPSPGGPRRHGRRRPRRWCRARRP